MGRKLVDLGGSQGMVAVIVGLLPCPLQDSSWIGSCCSSSTNPTQQWTESFVGISSCGRRIRGGSFCYVGSARETRVD